MIVTCIHTNYGPKSMAFVPLWSKV